MKELIFKNLSIIIILLISTNVFSQNYYCSPIEITDIIKGWEDPDYFNAVLMEKGFECSNIHSEQPNWRVPYKNEEPLIHILISEYHSIEYDYTTKNLSISIRKDLMSKYIADFKKAIIEYFPTKEVYISKGTRTRRGITKKNEIYVLRYTKKGTNITVDCRTNQPFDTDDFAIVEIKFMNTIVKD